MGNPAEREANIFGCAAFVALTALVALSPFIVAIRAADQFFLPKALFVRQMIVIVAALSFLKLVYTPGGLLHAADRALGRHERRVLFGSIVFLLAASLSAASSSDLSSTIPPLVDIALGILLFASALVLVEGERRLKTIFYVFIGAGFCTGLIAAVQYHGFFPGTVRADSLMPAFGRRAAAGLLGNSGISSAYLAAVALMAFGALASLKREQAKTSGVAIGLATLGALYGFALSRALASAAGFLGGVVFFLLIGGRFLGRKRFWLACGCLALVLVLGAAFYLQRGQRGYDAARGVMRGDLASALSNRGIIWLTTWKMAADRPLIGHGLGRFQVDYYEYYGRALKDIGENSSIRPKANDQWETAHSEYLQLLSETGAVGFSAAIFFLWVYFRAIAGNFKAAKEGMKAAKKGAALLALGFAAAFVSVLVDSLASFPFHTSSTAAMGLIAAACGLKLGLPAAKSLPKRSGGRRETVSPPGDRMHTAKLALSWAACSITVVYAFINLWGAYSASVHYQNARDYLSAHAKMFHEAAAKGRDYTDQAYLRAALAEVEKALMKNSSDGKIAYLRGRALAMSGSFDKSISEMKRARRRYRDTHLDYDLGVVLEAKGQLRGAAVYYEKALSYDPWYFEDPRLKLKEIRRKLGDTR